MENKGSSFIHQRYPQLHLSGPVELACDQARREGQRIPNIPTAKLEVYLGRLAQHSLISDNLTSEEKDIAKKRSKQIEARIVEYNEGNVRRYGEDKVLKVREDQHLQLNEWISWLSDEENKFPTWFMYLALDFVTKSNRYDESTKKFSKRSKNSLALFPAFDNRSLEIVYDVFSRQLKGEPIEVAGATPELLDLIKKAARSGDFANLYAGASEIGFAIGPELRDNLNGEWRKYDQSDSRIESDELVRDISKYRHEWCTAGPQTAYSYLSEGDFYIWYSDNSNGVREVPRVAIYVVGGRIAEIRGVNPHENLEPRLGEVVFQKIKNMPGSEDFLDKVEDVIRLNELERKITLNPDVDLSTEEISFLYELDRDIKGFGTYGDPAILKIRRRRGERDKAALQKMLIESIRRQIISAFGAYLTVTTQIGQSNKEVRPITQAEFEETFELQHQSWLDGGVYDYLVEQQMKYGGFYSLIASPNIEVNFSDIVHLVDSFAKELNKGVGISDYLRRQSHYTSSDLEIQKGESLLRLSLVPARDDHLLSGKPALKQRQLLAKIQEEYPGLGLRAPSILDAVVYWQTLYAQGFDFDDEDFSGRLYFRHFNLEPITLEVDLGLGNQKQKMIPLSFIPNNPDNTDEGVCIHLNDSLSNDTARLIVG